MDDTNGKSNGSTDDAAPEVVSEPATVMISRVPGQQDQMVTDMTSFPTVLEVARRAGVSHQAVRQWQRKGKLTALEDAEGTTRFHPAEVERFLAERSDTTDIIGDMEGPRTEGAAAASIYFRPREKLDDFVMKMLDRSERQVERLMQHNERMEKILESSFERRETEEAARAERKLVADTLAAETKMKETLVENVARGVATVGELLTKIKPGGGAGKPTIDFLEDLSLETLTTLFAANDLFSEEAQAKILRVLQQKQREDRAATEAKKKAAEAAKETPAPSSSSAPNDSAAAAAEGEK